MKTTLLIVSVSLGLAFTSCTKCVECTESSTQYSQDFCGKGVDVKLFEKELKRQGQAYGQTWTCVNK
jgi:hypothetical protein